MQFHIWRRSTLKHTLLCDYYHKSLPLNIEDDLIGQTYKLVGENQNGRQKKCTHIQHSVLWCIIPWAVTFNHTADEKNGLKCG